MLTMYNAVCNDTACETNTALNNIAECQHALKYIYANGNYHMYQGSNFIPVFVKS